MRRRSAEGKSVFCKTDFRASAKRGAADKKLPGFPLIPCECLQFGSVYDIIFILYATESADAALFRPVLTEEKRGCIV